MVTFVNLEDVCASELVEFGTNLQELNSSYQARSNSTSQPNQGDAPPRYLIMVGSDSDGSIYLDSRSIDIEDGANYPSFKTIVTYNRSIPAAGKLVNSYLLSSFADCVEGFLFTTYMEAYTGRYANGDFVTTYTVDEGQDRNSSNDKLFREICSQ